MFASLSALIVVFRRFRLRLFTVNSPIRYVLMSVVHFHCFSVAYSMSSLVVFFTSFILSLSLLEPFWYGAVYRRDAFRMVKLFNKVECGYMVLIATTYY